MKITATDAVEHIYNNLDATGAADWHDVENGTTWHVSTAGPGVIEFTFVSEDSETTQTFRLVEDV